MSKRPFVIFGIFAAICLIALPFIALGKEGDEQAATVSVASRDTAGKELFDNNCGYCHTLAAAGTDGIVGPDLDDALVPTASNSEEQFGGSYTRVLTAINCGIGGRMPKGILIGEEAESTAAFVAAYAGQIGKGPVADTETAETPPFEGCQPAS